MQDIEQAIRERAYQLWIESGCQDGEADTHWLAAQREIISVSLGELGRVAVTDAATKQKTPRGARKKRQAA
jgi:hypothetical protein